VRTGSGDFYQGIDFRYSGVLGRPRSTSRRLTRVPVARDGRLGDRLIATNYNNFAPRLGIAYSPTDKWSIRAGFGIFFSQESKNSIFDLNRGLGGRTGRVPNTPIRAGIRIYRLSQYRFPSGQAPRRTHLGRRLSSTDHLQSDYVLNVQRTLGRSSAVEVGYNGSQSRHLGNLINARSPFLAALPVITRMPYPEFGAAGIQFLKNDGVPTTTASARSLATFRNQPHHPVQLHMVEALTMEAPFADPAMTLSLRTPAAAPVTMAIRPSTSASLCGIVLYTLPIGKGSAFSITAA